MIGQRLAHYEIVDKIGEGGMGAVYRAHDSRLGRDVAIKVLLSHQLESADARARFEREVKAVAALSHPNILGIHDVGEHDGTMYAVTELLDGRTLLEQLRTGPLPLRYALELAGQMADGLAAAHDKGIIHRDIKPANLFLTTDGRLKILDFGLAKASLTDDGKTLSATVAESTSPGTVLGTVRYMSPEQVRGEVLDHRSDIFSFGAVMWEMLSGAPAFSGDSAVETMSAILREDPPELSMSGDATPVSVDRILRRCLEKTRERRFQSAQDLAFALRNAADPSSRVTPAAALARTPPPSRARPILIGLLLVLLGGVLGAQLSQRMRTAAYPEPVQIVKLTHSGQDYAPSASPDSRMIAFISNRDGRDRVWLRQQSGGVEVPLTDGPDLEPKFSPDGSSVLFLRWEESVIAAYRVSVVGGPARRLLDNVSGACWSPDGLQIAFIRVTGTVERARGAVGIYDLQSGKITELASFENRQLYGLAWSPDGRWISLSSTAAVQNSSDVVLFLIDAATGEINPFKQFSTRISSAAWTPDGDAMIVAESTSLLGDISGALGRVLRIDLATGDEQPLFWVDSVWAGTVDYVRFDFLGNDTLLFDEVLWRGNLTEVSLEGTPPFTEGRTLTRGNSRDRQPVYSRDGSSVVFSSSRSGNLDIWSLDPSTGQTRQITDDEADDWDPAFSADGQRVLWSSNREGHLEIWTARIDGSDARRLTSDGVDAENPTQTPDGEWVVYGSGNPLRSGIWKIRSDGSEEVQIASGSYFLPEVSPDGHHVAYVGLDPGSNSSQLLVSDIRSGELVFSISLPWRGFQALIQEGRARWMPDGRSLVFVGADENDRGVLFIQDFAPHTDTSQSRRPLVKLSAGQGLESFGLSPDGKSVTVARVDHFRSLKLARGVSTARR